MGGGGSREYKGDPDRGKKYRLNIKKSQESNNRVRYAKTGGNVLGRGDEVRQGYEYAKGTRKAKDIKADRKRFPTAYRSTGIKITYDGNVKYPNRIVRNPNQKLGN